MKQPKGKGLEVGIDGTPFFRPIDGIGRYSHEIVSQLARQQPESKFTIIGFRGDKPNDELVNDLPGNIEFVYLPLPRRLYQGFFSRLFAINLAGLLPRFDHVIHLNFTLFPYIRRKGLKNVLFIHDTTFIDIPEVVTPKNLSYLKRRVPWSIKRADMVMTISDFTKARVKEIYKVPSSKIHMVGTGVQDIFFKKSKKLTNLPGKYILAIGTLEPRKNLESLVKAHGKLPIKLQEKYPLVLGGSLGWDNQNLRRLIEKSENIHHLGYVDDADLPALYQGASLFVFPSIYEGFGIPLLEAMASRTPVLANDIELFRSIGEDYINYVDTKNTSKLTKAVINMLENPPSKEALDSGQRHAKKFSWSAVATKLWNCINQ